MFVVVCYFSFNLRRLRRWGVEVSWSELYLFISIRREIFIPWPQISPSVVSLLKIVQERQD